MMNSSIFLTNDELIEEYAGISPFGGDGLRACFQIAHQWRILKNRALQIFAVQKFQAMDVIAFKSFRKIIEMGTD